MWRHLRAILLLPVMVTLVVPGLIMWRTGVGGWDLPQALAVVPIVAGLALAGVGLTLVVWTVALFARVGRGTLAPWDVTSRLVVRGPYRHVRNPMISGIVLVLLGQAAALGSVALLVWAVCVLAVNAIYLPLVEERSLEARFGEEYAAYRANVPRWLPRRRPWEPHTVPR